MKFAISIEGDLAQYYANENLVNRLELEEEYKVRTESATKRQQMLLRSRQENVTEIILEPIEGLKPENYQLNIHDYSIEGIRNNEYIATKFYDEAGPKINVLETRRLFKRCWKEHSRLYNSYLKEEE